MPRSVAFEVRRDMQESNLSVSYSIKQRTDHQKDGKD